MNSQALWYLTRGFGLVSLVLLTLTTVLGLAQVSRYMRPGWPRFVISALHKNASLLAVVAIAIHVITAVLDTYAPVAMIDAFIPLASRYRPLWTGLGALSFDLMLAVVITSLLRERLGQRAWRAIHWAAYASWPIAVLHGLGTGSDSKFGWVQFIYVVSTLAVVAALWWRLAKGWNPVNAALRGTAAVVSIAVAVAIGVWSLSGPLQKGWARRAGTPSSLLTAAARSSATSSARSTGAAASGAPPALALPFDTTFQGSQSENRPDANGNVSIVLSGTFPDGTTGSFHLVLSGQPAEGGGVELTGSQVSIGPAANPSEFQGHVTQLDGDTIVASVSDSAGTTAQAVMVVRQQDNGNALSGSIRMRQ